MKWKKLEVLEEQIRNDVNAIMYEKGTTTGSSQQQSTEGISKIFPAKNDIKRKTTFSSSAFALLYSPTCQFMTFLICAFSP